MDTRGDGPAGHRIVGPRARDGRAGPAVVKIATGPGARDGVGRDRGGDGARMDRYERATTDGRGAGRRGPEHRGRVDRPSVPQRWQRGGAPGRMESDNGKSVPTSLGRSDS